MIVQEVMSPEPFVAKATTSVGQVLRMLREADVRHLPIVENQMLVGIVSDRDLRLAMPSALDALEKPREVERMMLQPVASLMNTDVIYVHPESELSEAADLMIEHKIGALPVVEPESLKLVGIVSYVDLLRETRDAL